MRPNTWITPIGNWGKGRSNWSRFPVQRKSTITSSPIGFPRICRRWVSSSKLHIAFIFRAKISWTPLRSCNRYAGRRRRADLCSEQEDFRLLHSRTAVLMPICNENVARLFAGLEASYRSLAATSELRHFDFYVFSDTRDPDRQVEEEVAWAQGRQTRAMKNPTVRAADRSSSAEVSWQTI